MKTMKQTRKGFLAGALAAAGLGTVSGKGKADAKAKSDLGKLKVLPDGRYDSHVHVAPGEPDPARLVKSFGEAGLAGGCIFSEDPNRFPNDIRQPHDPEKAIDAVIAWASGSPTIYPFYWIDPARPDACDLVDLAIEKGVYGFKVIRSQGRPCDEKSMPVYAKIAKYGKPLTFHTGILWDGRASSDNFRPANWEPLLDIPYLRFALAHVSWPWCDECIAVFGKLLNAIGARGEKVPEMFIDTTPGTPEIYRREVLTKVYAVGYDVHDHVMFGTDGTVNRYNTAWAKKWMGVDDAVYAELKLSARQIDANYRTALQRYLFGGDNSGRKIPTPDDLEATQVVK